MKVHAIILSVMFSYTAYAQNTFPSSGNVGIGTTSPTTPLQVDGLVKFDGPNADDQLVFKYGAGFHQIDYTQLRFQENGIGTVLTMNNGRLGIGTTNPSTPLQVNGMVKFDGPNADDQLVFKYGTGFHQIDYTQLRFQENGHGTILTMNNGRIGIGTTDPQSLLAVDGVIRAEEVKVMADVDVPDYVFKKDYQLRTLQAVEAYVKQHSHLPEVPSEAEILDQGIDLAEMNMILLKKVEELTLYMIAQQKEIETLKTQLK